MNSVLPACSRRRSIGTGFTLLELLVVIGIIGLLLTISFQGYKSIMGQATGAHCTSNLRQLSAAVNLYSGDNEGAFPPYVKYEADGSRTWYFGRESTPEGTAEGDRDLDQKAGPLYPYIQSVGSIEVCKGFNYGTALWKAKFKGASYGYGYNWNLGGKIGGPVMRMVSIRNAAQIILFGDCAQANTFQAPASASKPMLEEFYILDEKERTAHFRHSGRANMVFVDGHVESFKPFKGSADTRIKGEIVGRIVKKGDTSYFK